MGNEFNGPFVRCSPGSILWACIPTRATHCSTAASWCGCPQTSRRVPVPVQLIPPSLGLACIRKDVLVQLDHTHTRETQLTPIKEFIRIASVGSLSKQAITVVGCCCCI